MQKYSNFIYLEKKDFLFCYVPKVACTNWKCLFRNVLGFEDYLNAEAAHNRIESGLTYVSETDDPVSVVSDPAIYKACFIRNLYARILSAYLNKIDRINEESGPIKSDVYFDKVYESIRQDLGLDPGGVTFINFLDWLKSARKDESFGYFDEHWRDQSDLLCLDSVKFDFIGNFESLTQDANVVLNVLGGNLKFPTHSEVKFAATKASEKVKEYYGKSEIELVNQIYEADFHSLGCYGRVNNIEDMVL